VIIAKYQNFRTIDLYYIVSLNDWHHHPEIALIYVIDVTHFNNVPCVISFIFVSLACKGLEVVVLYTASV